MKRLLHTKRARPQRLAEISTQEGFRRFMVDKKMYFARYDLLDTWLVYRHRSGNEYYPGIEVNAPIDAPSHVLFSQYQERLPMPAATPPNLISEAEALAKETGRTQYVGYTPNITWSILKGPPAPNKSHWRIEPDGSMWVHDATHAKTDGFEYKRVVE